MGRNAQRRRTAKAANALRRRAGRMVSLPPRPVAYLDLRQYLVDHFGMTRKEAMAAILEGKVNVNGEVQGYRDFPKHQLERDGLGRPRIMVEGMPDPRPPAAGILLKRKEA